MNDTPPTRPASNSMDEEENFRRMAQELIEDRIQQSQEEDPCPCFLMLTDQGVDLALVDPGFMDNPASKDRLADVLGMQVIKCGAKAAAFMCVAYLKMMTARTPSEKEEAQRAYEEGRSIRGDPLAQEVVMVFFVWPDLELLAYAPLNREASRGVWLGAWEELPANMTGESRFGPKMQLALTVVRETRRQGKSLTELAQAMEKFEREHGGLVQEIKPSRRKKKK